MTYYVTFNGQTNNLIDISDSAPSLADSGLVLKTFEGSVPDLYFYKWDKDIQEFKIRADISRTITVHEFLNKFTAIERIAIREAAATNIALADYMDLLYQATFVDLSDPELFGGLSYLNYLGLIENSRINEILT